jgi:hypothetical protein
MDPLRAFLTGGAAVVVGRWLFGTDLEPAGPLGGTSGGPLGYLLFCLQHPWRAAAALGCLFAAFGPRRSKPEASGNPLLDGD